MPLDDPRVLIISGSGSDEAVVKQYQVKLESFGVHSDWRIASAHRTPEHAAKLFDYFDKTPDYLAGGAVASFQNALAAAWAANTSKPVYALRPEIGSVADATQQLAEVLGVLYLPPGVSAPLVVGVENGALALAKVAAGHVPEVATNVRKYLDDKASKVMKKDAELWKVQEEG
jgi:5-(carboxyamino)imidazole ribonucleotide mutase